jgi:N-acetylmuramoyl-L-alanine amidase
MGDCVNARFRYLNGVRNAAGWGLQFLARTLRYVGRFVSAGRTATGLSCVGLIVLSGQLIFVIAPDPEPRRVALSDGTRRVVVIDPGHGGMDEGARAAGLKEKDVTLDVALRVEQCLQNAGVSVSLTRREDVRMRLRERLAVVNGFEHPIFVSIHFNQSRLSSASGVEIFYAPSKPGPEWLWAGFFNAPEVLDNDEARELAGLLRQSVTLRTQAMDRGIHRRAFFLVRHARGPAVLVEGGFLSHPKERRSLGSPEYRQELAEGVAQGVVEFLKRQNHGGSDGTPIQQNP